MNRQIKYGIVLQYMQMALSILINLIYTPIMIKILGDGEYGIYSLASSIISYLNLLSLGFGASYLRFYSRCKLENEKAEIKRLNGLYLSVFSIIGIVSLMAGLFITANVTVFFNETYSAEDIYIARYLMLLLAINMAISFPASVFVSYMTSQEKFIFQKLVNMGKTVLSPMLSIAMLFLGYGSIGMVLVTTGISLVIDVINIYYCVAKLQMRFEFGKPNWKLLKEIAVFSIFIAINEVVNQVNWQTGKLILGKMLTSQAVAIYSVASTLNSMYLTFSTAISNVFAPRVNQIVVLHRADENKQLTKLFIQIGRLQFFVIMLILSGFVFFGRFFINIWAGESYHQAYAVTLLLICPVTIALIQNIGIEIQRAKNMHKFRSVVYFIMAILNIAISIVFCHYWGIIGVTMGTSLSLIIGNIVIMNIYYHQKMGINMILFWKSIASIIPALIPPIIVGIAINTLHSITGIIDFGFCIMIYTTVYVISIFFIGLSNEEKEKLKAQIVKIKRRTHG